MRCPKTGKKGYFQEKHAKIAAKGCQKGNGQKTSVFFCDHCGFFHVGREDKWLRVFLRKAK